MSSESWHVAPILGVRNVRRGAEYYRDVLGFHLDPENGVIQPTADEPGGVYAIVDRDGISLHLQIRRGEIPERTRQAFERDVYFYVDDVDAVHTDLRARGAIIRQPPRMAPYGIRELEVEDIHGYRLTFGQRN